MTKEEMQKYESGFNEGLMYGVQLTVSEILRIINNHPTWLLKPDKISAEAHFKMAAKRILQRRGLVPYEYDVMTGKAEPVELDFNIDIEMETKTVKITTCMRGLKKWIDAHPRKNLRGFFTINGRDMTDTEVRRVVSYAVEKGYETEADIPSAKLAELLKGGNYEK